MAEVIRMPKMSDTMEEGIIANWLVKEGDAVKSGDILAEVETDKATMELENYEDGVLLHIGIKEKEAAPVDGVIAIIGKKGENIDALLKEISEAKANTKEAVTEAPPVEVIDTSGIKASLITMPKMSDTMTEGTIASWQKKVGDKVSAGDILAEVETDKATMELESYEDGVLLYIGVKEGESVVVDGVLAIVGEKGADFETLMKAHEVQMSVDAVEKVAEVMESAPTNVAPSQPETSAVSTLTAQPTTSISNGRIKASPLAKRLAVEKGFDLAQISGTGDHGRIIKKDVETFVPSAGGMMMPQIVAEEKFEEVPVSQMRKVIAKRLAESKYSAPHFYLTMEINMDKVMDMRKSLNEILPTKISFNDIIVKATALAIRQNPDVNVSWLGDRIRKNQHIHIGIAVAVEDGLLVPVVRFTDNKSISHISTEIKELAKKAAEKKLQPQDWEGNTFSISNLGMFGIEEFTAIINPPDACILAVGGIKQTAVVKDGQLVPGNVMKVTLSCDHRAVDGAVGSAFLKSLKIIIEDPIRMMV